MSGHLEQFPRREDLPKEFAAISMPGEQEGDDPTIIINLAEDNARAVLRSLRPHVLIPVTFGWVADRLRRAARKHTVVAAVAGVLVVGGVASATTAVFVGRRPPSTAGHSVAVTPSPAATHTVTATVAVSQWTVPPSKPPRRSRSAHPPANSYQPVNSRPQPSQSPNHSSHQPVSKTPEPTRTPRPRADKTRTSPPTAPADNQPALSAREAGPPAAEPPPAQPTIEASGEEPLAAGDGCGGVVHVEIDPLLDVCLLG